MTIKHSSTSTMSDSLETRLEDMIMRHAAETSVSVRLAFLITMQRHILYLTEQIGHEQEVQTAQHNDLVEIINEFNRGALPNAQQVIDKLIDLTAWEEPEP